MNFLKIIFLLMLFVDSAYPADEEAVEKVATAVDDVPVGGEAILEAEAPAPVPEV
jgi:hypothetical protein